MNRILPQTHMLMTEPSLDLISFPSAIDNTIRSTFVACPQKFFYSHLNRLSPTGTNVHLHAGGAFAAVMEAARLAFYREGLSVDDSIAAGVAGLITYYGDYECPEDSAKSLTRMAGALEYYFSVHPMDSDYVTPHKTAAGGLGIEFSFAIPLPFEHPETGDPLVYTGSLEGTKMIRCS